MLSALEEAKKLYPATLFLGELELKELTRLYKSVIPDAPSFKLNGVTIIPVNLKSYCAYVPNSNLTELD